MNFLKLISRVLSLLLPIFAVTACAKSLGDGKPLTNAAGTSTSSTDNPSALAYQYVDPTTNCSTGLRSFKSQAELCLNLQIPLNNNGDCAADQRHARNGVIDIQLMCTPSIVTLGSI